MKWDSLGRSFLAVLVALFVASGAWAQATASLRGTVTDPSGAVVIGAKVTLTNTATNIARQSITSGDGGYLFELVQPGTYKLAVSNSGFSTFTQTGIVLEVNQNGRLDVKLELGQSTQVVEVTGNVAQVDTTGAVLGKVEDERRLQDHATTKKPLGSKCFRRFFCAQTIFWEEADHS